MYLTEGTNVYDARGDRVGVWAWKM